MRNRVHMRVLQRAAEIAGGGAALARYLQVPPLLVAAWIAGAAEMPLEAFIRLVDIVIDDKANRGIPALQAQDLKYTEAANS